MFFSFLLLRRMALVDATNLLIDSELADWWVEGGEKVWAENGRLHVNADSLKEKYATVWYKKPLPANVKIEADACVLHSSVGGNNINFFLSYSDPSGRRLEETRSARSLAGYQLYHPLNGYIFTFLRDHELEGGATVDAHAKARFRIRRCPGFNLLSEKFDSCCEANTVYHIVLRKEGGHLSISVNGAVKLEAIDLQPLEGGYFGLRTWRSELWWSNIRFTEKRVSH